MLCILDGVAVDTALSQTHKSSALSEIFGRWFGALGRPSAVPEVMVALGRLPKCRRRQGEAPAR